MICLLLLMSGFFSGSETALTAASRARINTFEKEGDQRAGIVSKLLESRERLIGALLLGNNLVNIFASALMTGLALSIFGEVGVVYATLVMTLLVLIFAEVLPKTYAITKPNRAAIAVARPVSVVVAVFAPIVWVIQNLVNWFLKMFGMKSDAGSWTAADEIRDAVDLHHQEGGVAKRARDQIMGVLQIGDLTVEDVMIHRKNLIMLEADLSSTDMVNEVLNSGHTRLPVWKDDMDNVIGILHAKDMLKEISASGVKLDKLDLSKTFREPWFVPETTPVVTQLRAFQQKREHFALAVDEYGALMGVVTLEDILEEIVGDIQDEFDEIVEGVRVQKDGSIVVGGEVAVRDLNRAVDFNLPDQGAVTIAGLVIHESQTIPDVGRIFSFHGYRFEVLSRRRNQITSLRVSKNEDQDDNET
ncbi:MAG: HlyC/CorC family transporter [Acidimicrobiales bacterium]|nr:MAG: HlyC/CorC family transporter [Acidimicrobiales bacterium]